MKTFMSLSDLDRLTDDDPAKPVVRQLLEWLIADGEFPDLGLHQSQDIGDVL
jgi:hypothetical protein